MSSRKAQAPKTQRWPRHWLVSEVSKQLVLRGDGARRDLWAGLGQQFIGNAGQSGQGERMTTLAQFPTKPVDVHHYDFVALFVQSVPARGRSARTSNQQGGGCPEAP